MRRCVYCLAASQAYATNTVGSMLSGALAGDVPLASLKADRLLPLKKASPANQVLEGRCSMNVFQLIRTVLDEVYVQIPFDDTDKDAKIRARLDYLSKQYARLVRGTSIDYCDPVTRFAYIYRYVTSHADIVHQLVSKSAHLSTVFNTDRLVATCIGGGPGSDFLGMLKYLMQAGKTPELKCYLYDREGAWADSWSDVDDKLHPSFRISTFFQLFDVTNPTTWQAQTKYLKSDLYTMIYFMSEVFSIRDEAAAFFQHLFQNTKPGALFLYVDNNSTQFSNWFDDLRETNGLAELEREALVMYLDPCEEKSDLYPYIEKFPCPKLTADIACRVCCKT